MPETLLALYTLLLGCSTMLVATPLFRELADKAERKLILKGTIPKNIKEVKFSPDIEEQIEDIDISKISDVYRDTVKLFVERIDEKFDKDTTKLMHRNINTLAISRFDELKRLKYRSTPGTGAAYWTKENKIIIYEYDNVLISLFHELLHMSSTIVKDGITYSGFSQKGPKIYIGSGLNEGYTQYLCKKYFGDQKTSDSYPYFVHYVGLLERVVGAKRMESYYMNADLRSLIEDLKNYASEEDIMRFINNLDFINLEVGCFTERNYLVKDEISNAMREISSFIVHAYIEKFKDSSIRFYKAGQFNRMIKSKEEFTNFVTRIINKTHDTYKFFEKYEFECSIKDEKHMEEFNAHIDRAWESIESIKQTKIA